MQKKIPRNVFILGLVSFFNDFASEMIYPIIPLFLTSVLHTSIPVIGLIEGIAEALASISKYVFGAISDYFQKRKVFVVWGYSLGAISKLLIGLAYTWPLVLFARIIDRLGKGLRTASRDSILLENTTPQDKGYIFGFHRAFDSLGAVVGPLVALLTIYFLKNNIRLTFFIAFIPGVIAITLLILFLKEKKKSIATRNQKFVKIDWKNLDPHLKIFLIVSFLFSLGNSSDTFLLLNAKNLGMTTTIVVLMYVLYNISQTVFSTPAGLLADKLGAKKVFMGGLFVFSLVYFFFGFVQSSLWLWFLFPLYGIYIAATDGVSKSYIAEFITAKESGTYFGAYYTLTAVGAFFASFIGGILWSKLSPSATFYFGSILSFSAFMIFIIFQSKKILVEQ
ncbi:MFS transporter [Candidatus Roizmanbacteria bacterium CG_4_8_14_3_um_filter_34_9]|uniref:MFS transporter n=3 Tax=Candidatus Roizmaniibacteriota TaxID=1752723 RepID=A0A2M7AVP4_9BACT|nr:MAG: MFS transporter [Candidatus Roizmanbacteria bacterium CG07_land_8_20_14_0_80_34_15]PIU74710.1 MAG: MFS transporter [Candidatus Roizmanbacteria bacterium CG06_land_8_20_14_3_00_34_14]PIW73511.1 MAG: MFS transporter [Candidatus Roizmanbacteria bacterium CG_4_8_14_3_um_filter_34_9]